MTFETKSSRYKDNDIKIHTIKSSKFIITAGRGNGDKYGEFNQAGKRGRGRGGIFPRPRSIPQRVQGIFPASGPIPNGFGESPAPLPSLLWQHVICFNSYVFCGMQLFIRQTLPTRNEISSSYIFHHEMSESNGTLWLSESF